MRRGKDIHLEGMNGCLIGVLGGNVTVIVMAVIVVAVVVTGLVIVRKVRDGQLILGLAQREWMGYKELCLGRESLLVLTVRMCHRCWVVIRVLMLLLVL